MALVKEHSLEELTEADVTIYQLPGHFPFTHKACPFLVTTSGFSLFTTDTSQFQGQPHFLPWVCQVQCTWGAVPVAKVPLGRAGLRGSLLCPRSLLAGNPLPGAAVPFLPGRQGRAALDVPALLNSQDPSLGRLGPSASNSSIPSPIPVTFHDATLVILPCISYCVFPA